MVLEAQTAADPFPFPVEEPVEAEPAAPAGNLWVAALAQYFRDVRAPSADRGEALADFRGERRILSRLAELAGYDPETLADLALGDIQAAKFRRGHS